MKQFKKVLAILLVLGLSLQAGFAQIFVDVPDDHWAKTYIENLYREDILKGKTPETFAPQKSISNQELAVILTRIEKPTQDTITKAKKLYDYVIDTLDIEEYAKESVAFVWFKGIMAEGVFYQNGKDTAVRKDDMCVYLIRQLGLETQAKAYNSQNSSFRFNDEATISQYKRGYVYLAREKGIVNGDEAGNFNPNNEITRAEAAKMLYITKQLRGNTSQITPPTPTVPQTTKVTGIVKSFVKQASNYIITLQKADGSLENITVTDTTPFYRDALTTSVSTITIGETLNIEKTAISTVKRIDGTKVVQTIIEGRLNAVQTSTNTIVFEKNINNQWIQTQYRLDGSTAIYVNGVAATINQLQKGQTAKLTIANNQLKMIQTTRKENVLTGILATCDIANGNIEVKVGNELKKFNINSSISVIRNSMASNLSQLKTGDRVVLTLDDEDILSIVTNGENGVKTGKIDSIYIAKEPKVYFLDGSQMLNVYQLNSGCVYKDNLTNKSIYDLRLGQQVELEIKDSEIASIKWNGTSSNVQEIGILKGVDILNAQIIIEKEGTVIPVFTGLSKIYDPFGQDISVYGLLIGQRIAVTGQYKNNRFEAITIVVMP